ncbi:hypothetical protein AGMMS49991_06910 [Spirochaetia bacterium]|nr:hypothetical protein AGMMS49991_06910 [Spirochaetia bacterium]
MWRRRIRRGRVAEMVEVQRGDLPVDPAQRVRDWQAQRRQQARVEGLFEAPCRNLPVYSA